VVVARLEESARGDLRPCRDAEDEDARMRAPALDEGAAERKTILDQRDKLLKKGKANT